MASLNGWVETIPAPPSPSWVDTKAAAKGEALFVSTGCSTCHSGTKLTNNQTVDVGTGGAFQVPPLVGVGWRTPLLHTGCADTVEDRFTKCATAGHGDVSKLSTADIANMSAFLETL
jgi:cytochrome c peroxidase